MSDISENQKIADFIFQFKHVLKHFLVPIQLLDFMPFLENEVCIEIRKYPESPGRQVDLFLSALKSKNEPGTLKVLLDAVYKKQIWLFPLLNGDLSEELRILIVEDLEILKQIHNLMKILKPSLNFNAEEALDNLTEYFPIDEREFLMRKSRNDGNSYASAWFIYALERKGKDCIKAFCDYLCETYGPNEEMGEAACLILECMDIDNDEECLKKEIKLSENNFNCFETSHEGGFDGSDEVEVPLLDLNITNDSQSESPTSEGKFEYANEVVEEEDDDNVVPIDRNLILRGYQEELVRPAEDRKNVIICAPPGSGKTIVAAHIVKHYLEARGNTFKPVLFFCPGTALAQQQMKRLQQFLPEEFTVDACYGKTEDSSLELHDANVIVLTPQILLNALKDKAEENPIKSIGQYGLLIFDECHHCMKGHPYNGVMREYFYFYNENDENKQESPQVIGLTATLGIGKKTSEAENQILQLCSNMNAMHGIVTVQEPSNVDELIKRIPFPDQDTIVLKERINDPFNERLISDMNQLVNILKTLGEFSPPSYDDVYSNLEALKQWCVNNRNEVAKHGPHNSRDPVSCIEYLEHYGEARDLHLKCRAIDAIRCLEKFYDGKTPDNPNEIEKKLERLLQDSLNNHLKIFSSDRRCVNPNLGLIHDLILDKFKKEPTSTGMLMTKKRIYASALKDWINESPSLKFLNAEIFLGLNKSSHAAGLNHRQQEAIMKSFREGNHKIIICTPDSAGEGIDVSGCNFVINYDYLKTEVHMVQIKGRVRKDGGEVIELCSPKVAQRDRLNHHKTMIMQAATAQVEGFIKDDLSGYQKKLSQLQEESRVADDQAMRARLAKQQRFGNKEYRMDCRKCRAVVCSSRDMRVVDGNKHINATKEFKEKYQTKEHGKRGNDMGKNWKKKNKVHCRACDLDWGIEAVWKDCITLPLIKIIGFTVVDCETGKRVTPKKWKNAPFAPQELDLEELRNDLDFFDFA